LILLINSGVINRFLSNLMVLHAMWVNCRFHYIVIFRLQHAMKTGIIGELQRFGYAACRFFMVLFSYLQIFSINV